LYHGARSLTRLVFNDARRQEKAPLAVQEVLRREPEIVERLRQLSSVPFDASRIRCHGDYHLGQVLWTGKDFVIIDFEGEPTRSLGRRRLKRPALVDLAGMVRSFHYASRAAADRIQRDLSASVASIDPGLVDAWLTFWHRWVSGVFIRTYRDVVEKAEFLPHDETQFSSLLNFFLLEKSIYELNYELNSRPTWAEIPARGILELLEPHG
ncbi:MAG: phosphotransferase, partial [Acidimicrobiales bacterium]